MARTSRALAVRSHAVWDSSGVTIQSAYPIAGLVVNLPLSSLRSSLSTLVVISISDNEDDCGDNSDEITNCPARPFQCSPNKIKCPGTLEICVNRTQLCDGRPDCPDSYDEGPYCSRDDCALRNGDCSHTCLRSPLGAVCLCPTGFATKNTTN
jgi:hypothetical protein